jgi:hypothetical protein
MDAGTNGLADAEVWWMSIRRMSTTASPDLKNALLTGSELVDTHIPFLAEGGYYREEAIMLLRRFYMSENQNGTPRSA